MIELLKRYNYIPPKLKDYVGKNIIVDSNIFRTFSDKVYKSYSLSENGEQWMSYNYFTHEQAFELFSHYYLAKGHCICTGLGFGVRENWLLQKKDVSKITIIEKNEELLDYHKYINSPFIKECEIIIGDASELKNKKCDTLLLDHYEFQSESFIFNDVKKISENNEFDIMWFWPLEAFILRTIQTQDTYNNDNVYNFHSVYNFLKKKFNLNNLPDVDEETLQLFCFLFQSVSYFCKKNTSDKKYKFKCRYQ